MFVNFNINSILQLIASRFKADQFVKAIECRQGLKIACLEEIAFSNGWIDEEQLEARVKNLEKTEYAKYLR